MSVEELKSVFEPEKPQVPNDWSVASFNDVVEVVSDKGKRTKQRDYLEEGVVPVIDQGQDFIGGYIDDESMAFEGELPIVVFGDHTRAVKFVSQRFAVGADGVKILKPAECFEPKYFYYLLKSLNVPSRGYSRHFQFLKKFYLPIAPLELQKRIVAEIEKQFSRLDEAVANLKHVKANFKRYKAAVLKAAVEGKLTQEWRKQHPDVEPADKLLERILSERRNMWEEAELAKMQTKGKVPKNDKWKEKYKTPNSPSLSDERRLPTGWSFSGIEQLLPPSRDAMKTGPFGSLLKKHEHQASGVQVLGIENIQSMRFVSGSKIHITEDKAIELEGYRVDAGDILISRSGTVGEVCVVPNGIGEARISTNLMKISLRENGLLPEYFTFLFNGSPFVLGQVSELCKGSTRDFLNQDILKRILFPIPPLVEQIEIIEHIDRAFTLIVGLEGQIENGLLRADRLRQSILKQAFAGELVNTADNESKIVQGGI